MRNTQFPVPAARSASSGINARIMSDTGMAGSREPQLEFHEPPYEVACPLNECGWIRDAEKRLVRGPCNDPISYTKLSGTVVKTDYCYNEQSLFEWYTTGGAVPGRRDMVYDPMSRKPYRVPDRWVDAAWKLPRRAFALFDPYATDPLISFPAEPRAYVDGAGVRFVLHKGTLSEATAASYDDRVPGLLRARFEWPTEVYAQMVRAVHHLPGYYNIKMRVTFRDTFIYGGRHWTRDQELSVFVFSGTLRDFCRLEENVFVLRLIRATDVLQRIAPMHLLRELGVPGSTDAETHANFERDGKIRVNEMRITGSIWLQATPPAV